MPTHTSTRRFLMDERTLSKKLGVPLKHPIRVFTLENLGIDTATFVNFALPVFSTLHMDPYDAKRNKIDLLKKNFPQGRSFTL